MKHLITLLIAVMLVVSNVQADEYNVHIPNFNDFQFCENVICPEAGCANATAAIQQNVHDRNEAIKVKYLDIKYDQDAESLTLEAKVDNSGGKLANFFHLVLTDGDLDVGVKSCEGSVAHLYVDVTDPAAPKVNVFSFNGHLNLFCNNGESHNYKNQAHNGYDNTYPFGDNTGPFKNDASLKKMAYARNAPAYDYSYPVGAPIYDSVDASNASVVSYEDISEGGVQIRVLKLVLDVSDINDFDPVTKLVNGRTNLAGILAGKSYSYEGIQFGDRVGVWFWAAANASTTYYASGHKYQNYLQDLLTNKTDCSTCTNPEIETKTKVLCENSRASANPVEVGKTTTLSFDVVNKDINDEALDINGEKIAPVKVSYTGLPAGAKPSIPEGEEVIFDAEGKATIDIVWTPAEKQEGEYVIGATFTKEYGLGLETECAAVTVTVEPVTPECKEADLDPISQADQDMGQLAKLTDTIAARIIKLKKGLGLKPVVDDAKPADEAQLGWISFNNIVNKGTYFYECTNTQACAGGLQITNLSNDLANFRTSINNLKDIGISRAQKLQKVLTRHLIVNKGLTPQAAKTKAARQVKNNYLEGKVNNGVNPVYNSASGLVDLHVNSYGLNRFTCSNANQK